MDPKSGRKPRFPPNQNVQNQKRKKVDYTELEDNYCARFTQKIEWTSKVNPPLMQTTQDPDIIYLLEGKGNNGGTERTRSGLWSHINTNKLKGRMLMDMEVHILDDNRDVTELRYMKVKNKRNRLRNDINVQEEELDQNINTLKQKDTQIVNENIYACQLLVKLYGSEEHQKLHLQPKVTVENSRKLLKQAIKSGDFLNVQVIGEDNYETEEEKLIGPSTARVSCSSKLTKKPIRLSHDISSDVELELMDHISQDISFPEVKLKPKSKIHIKRKSSDLQSKVSKENEYPQQDQSYNVMESPSHSEVEKGHDADDPFLNYAEENLDIDNDASGRIENHMSIKEILDSFSDEEGNVSHKTANKEKTRKATKLADLLRGSKNRKISSKSKGKVSKKKVENDIIDDQVLQKEPSSSSDHYFPGPENSQDKREVPDDFVQSNNNNDCAESSQDMSPTQKSDDNNNSFELSLEPSCDDFLFDDNTSTKNIVAQKPLADAESSSDDVDLFSSSRSASSKAQTKKSGEVVPRALVKSLLNKPPSTFTIRPSLPRPALGSEKGKRNLSVLPPPTPVVARNNRSTYRRRGQSKRKDKQIRDRQAKEQREKINLEEKKKKNNELFKNLVHFGTESFNPNTGRIKKKTTPADVPEPTVESAESSMEDPKNMTNSTETSSDKDVDPKHLRVSRNVMSQNIEGVDESPSSPSFSPPSSQESTQINK